MGDEPVILIRILRSRTANGHSPRGPTFAFLAESVRSKGADGKGVVVSWQYWFDTTACKRLVGQ